MSYEDLYVSQLEAFLQQENTVVIDIRDINSFRQGHLKNAQHIDGPTMGNLIRLRKSNPAVLIYCYHGNSSRDMAKMIAGFGLSNVSHLVGGWQAWANYQIKTENINPLFSPTLASAMA